MKKSDCMHTLKGQVHQNLIKMDLCTRLISNKGASGSFQPRQLLHTDIGVSFSLQLRPCTIPSYSYLIVVTGKTEKKEIENQTK